jgi:hypothetical protein
VASSIADAYVSGSHNDVTYSVDYVRMVLARAIQFTSESIAQGCSVSSVICTESWQPGGS